MRATFTSIKNDLLTAWSLDGFVRVGNLLARDLSEVRQVIEVDARQGSVRVVAGTKVFGVPELRSPRGPNIPHVFGILGSGVGAPEDSPEPSLLQAAAGSDVALDWAQKAFHFALTPFFESTHDAESVKSLVLSGRARESGLFVSWDYSVYLGTTLPNDNWTNYPR